MDKRKKTILITGGAKRIGASIAELLVKNNYNVENLIEFPGH